MCMSVCLTIFDCPHNLPALKGPFCTTRHSFHVWISSPESAWHNRSLPSRGCPAAQLSQETAQKALSSPPLHPLHDSYSSLQTPFSSISTGLYESTIEVSRVPKSPRSHCVTHKWLGKTFKKKKSTSHGIKSIKLNVRGHKGKHGGEITEINLNQW